MESSTWISESDDETIPGLGIGRPPLGRAISPDLCRGCDRMAADQGNRAGVTGGSPAIEGCGLLESLGLPHESANRILREGAGSAARSLGQSRRALRRLMRQRGAGLREFARLRRRCLAATLLQEGASIASVAKALGYTSASNFARFVRREFGSSPSALRGLITANCAGWSASGPGPK